MGELNGRSKREGAREHVALLVSAPSTLRTRSYSRLLVGPDHRGAPERVQRTQPFPLPESAGKRAQGEGIKGCKCLSSQSSTSFRMGRAFNSEPLEPRESQKRQVSSTWGVWRLRWSKRSGGAPRCRSKRWC